MKKFDFSSVFVSLNTVVKRFPLVVGLLVLTVAVWMSWNHEIFPGTGSVWKLIQSFVFMIPLVIGVDLYSENSINSKAEIVRYGGWILTLLAGSGLFFASEVLLSDITVLRFVLFFVSALLLGIVLPSFHQFKKSALLPFLDVLIVRIFLGYLISSIVFFGFFLLLMAIFFFFNFDISERILLDMWLLIGGIFAPVFVLSGLPNGGEVKKYDNPMIWSLIVRFVMIFLTIAYLVLLYTGIGNILLTGVWPDDGLAAWIVGFLSIGVLTYYFSASYEEYTYVKNFRKAFFIFVLPLIFVLFYAVFIRIDQHGLTVMRYLAVAGGFWLLLSALYFLFSKKKDLKVGVFLLIFVLLFSAVSPFNAFRMSRISQLDRVYGMMVEGGVIDQGSFSKENFEQLTKQQKEAIGSKIYYVNYDFGRKYVDKYMNEKFPEAGVSDWVGFLAKDFDMYGWEGNFVQLSSNIRCESDTCLYDMEGYRYYLSGFLYPGAQNILLGEADILLKIDNESVVVKEGEQTIGEFNVRKLYEKYPEMNDVIPASDMSIVYNGKNSSGKIYFENFDLLSGEVLKIENVMFRVLFDKK